MRLFKSKKTLVLASVLLIFIDQLSKYIIRSRGGFYICNLGISFGLKIPTYLFYPLWLVIFLGLVCLSFKKYPKYSYAILLVLAGSVSNFIDRLFFGCVTDFIDFRIWPVFNLADVFICAGVFFLIIKLNKK